MPLWYDFMSLVFPRLCASCGNSLLRHEHCICQFCLHHLPYTDFHQHHDNPASRVFWGRLNLEAVASFFYFHKGSRVQHLIHGLKYKGKQETAYFLGKRYGQVLKQSQGFCDAEVIIPVPMHPRKQRKRGYNQSEAFARGLAVSMGLSTDFTSLIKGSFTETQTKKSRYSRWENVKEVFMLRQEKMLENKHVLLVDDVITTGATLEACVLELQKCTGVRVSIATLACAIK